MKQLPPMSKDVLKLNPELASELKTQPASKFKNVQTEARGIVFQSGREAAGVAELILLEEQHQIFGLRLQVRFPLPGGITYVADAIYLELRDGKLTPVVWDAKGYRTEGFRIKKKLFRERYGMDITEL